MDNRELEKFIEKWERIASEQDDEKMAKGMRCVIADLYQEIRVSNEGANNKSMCKPQGGKFESLLWKVIFIY